MIWLQVARSLGSSISVTKHWLIGTPRDNPQLSLQPLDFGFEFTAARIAVDQIMDMRMTLRYLGVSVRSKSFMFGDNQAVVTNSTIPHSTLNKRHNALAYHRVREMIAAKVLGYYWIDGKSNPADIVSKHWGYQQVWPLLKPILFYSGDTGLLFDDEEMSGMDNHGTVLDDLGEGTVQKGLQLDAKQKEKRAKEELPKRDSM